MFSKKDRHDKQELQPTPVSDCCKYTAQAESVQVCIRLTQSECKNTLPGYNLGGLNHFMIIERGRGAH